MTRDEVQIDMLNIVGDHLNVAHEDINDESTLESLGADSLDRVEIVMACEEKFNIQIDDNDLDGVNTFEKLVDLVTKKIGEGNN